MKKIVFFCLIVTNVFAQPGTLDQTFITSNIGNIGGPNGTVKKAIVQNDGKIILAGGFTGCFGSNFGRIVRVNSDGSLDPTFDSREGVSSGSINALAIQNDGKIVIGGEFFSYAGIAVKRIARLNPDGSLDNSFNPGLGPDNTVNTICLQNDGKILIGGLFTNFNNTTTFGLVRLNDNGTLDTSFENNKPVGIQFALAINVDINNKIVIGGSFFDIGNGPKNIIRLNNDGTIDNTFNIGTGADNQISTTLIQSNGKIVIGGSFNVFNGTTKSKLARLNPDGSLDNTFNTSFNQFSPSIYSTSIMSDGKLVINDYNSYNSVKVLNQDGSLDTSFNQGIYINFGGIETTSIQNDNKILLCGSFDTNSNLNKIARLNPDGSLDSSFFPLRTGTINVTSIQNDGKILIGGYFKYYSANQRNNILRLNSDGSLDETFNPIGTEENSSILDINIQNDGKILVAGSFSSFNNINKNGLVRLNNDGSIDNNFYALAGTNNQINKTLIQNDGKIILAGSFTTCNGISRNNIARLNSDGTIDNSFHGIGSNGGINCMLFQNDGKIIIVGGFTFYNGIAFNGIVRLNNDGTIDYTFNPGSGIEANGSIKSLSIQNDGKIIISGDFISYNGYFRKGIARINYDGTIDTTFNPGSGINGQVESNNIQDDGKIILGGQFESYNGSPVNSLVRLNVDGTIDTSFEIGMGVYSLGYIGSISSISMQDDGKIIIGGGFLTYNGINRYSIARINGETILANPNFDNKNINIYPNPTQNIFHMDIDKEYTGSIFDITGKLKMNINTKNIDISSLSTGIYFLKITSEGKSYTKKIIKE